MSAIRAERDYVIHEDFMKVKCFHLIMLSSPLCCILVIVRHGHVSSGTFSNVCFCQCC